jgi:methyl-accepting chemotaxis protein
MTKTARLPLAFKLPLIMVALTAAFLVAASSIVYKMAEANIRQNAYFLYETAAEAAQTAAEVRIGEVRRDLIRSAGQPAAFRALNNFNRVIGMLEDDPNTYLQHHYLSGNPSKGMESEKLTDPGDGSYYSQIHATYHPTFKEARVLGQYRNLYLLNAEGLMVYSVVKEPDFITGFAAGPNAKTGLGQAFAAAMKAGPGEVTTSDFAAYAPGGGAAGAFLAVPVFKKGKDTPFGVLAVQLSAAQMASVLGEKLDPSYQDAFLVDAEGLARTPSLLEGQFQAGDAIVAASHISAAAEGQNGLHEAVTATSGKEAIAVVRQVAAQGFNWSLVLETERAIAMGPVQEIHRTVLMVIAAAVAGAILVSCLAARRITRPLLALSAATNALAEGDYTSEIRGSRRGDEMGELARAMSGFRDKLKAADEAKARESEAARRTEQVVERMSGALAELERGNLACDIQEPFTSRFEALRENFNRSLANLRRSMGDVVDSAENVGRFAVEQKTSATDMAGRTESQASTLEETATAIQDLTKGVRATADSAAKVDETMQGTREEAERSNGIVSSAVQAMDEIQHASNEISQIINMIDDIAFQTNLLALNAGVEAARAGTAGAGFAVVASEVRALAQRASTAAGQIKELTEASEDHVANGVSMVGRAGEALTSIIAKVSEVSGLVSEIAGGVQTQSAGLENINDAMSQLDMVTQQNTAMAEEASAASQLLQDEAQSLSGIVSRFQMPGNAPAAPEAEWRASA